MSDRSLAKTSRSSASVNGPNLLGSGFRSNPLDNGIEGFGLLGSHAGSFNPVGSIGFRPINIELQVPHFKPHHCPRQQQEPYVYYRKPTDTHKNANIPCRKSCP